MDKDGGLKGVFRSKLTDIHWQAIESPITGAGTPDMNGCAEDTGEFWVENKRCDANAVPIDSFQVGWHERRIRMGGRTFLAVRLLATAGPRKGGARDELYLYRGEDIRLVFLNGLRGALPMYSGVGGPSKWDWKKVRQILRKLR